MSEYLERLYKELVNTGTEFGLSDTIAGDFAQAMIEKIKRDHAGPVYIPKPGKKQRNARIREMFNGVNHATVCAEFGISKATLYRIIGCRGK